jgi:hypothetical protein
MSMFLSDQFASFRHGTQGNRVGSMPFGDGPKCFRNLVLNCHVVLFATPIAMRNGGGRDCLTDAAEYLFHQYAHE